MQTFERLSYNIRNNPRSCHELEPAYCYCVWQKLNPMAFHELANHYLPTSTTVVLVLYLVRLYLHPKTMSKQNQKEDMLWENLRCMLLQPKKLTKLLFTSPDELQLHPLLLRIALPYLTDHRLLLVELKHHGDIVLQLGAWVWYCTIIAFGNRTVIAKPPKGLVNE